MAGNIRGITIEFSGDTTKLDKALRQINTETRNLDKELKQVDKALKFNPTNVDLWKQKQTLLTQKIEETRKKLDVLKQAQAQLDAKGVDKNSEEYRKLQREIIETESKLKTFEGQLKKIGNVNLRAMSEQFKEIGTSLEGAGRSMQGLSTAAAAVTAAIGALTVKSGKWADDMNTMSKVYHIGTGELQKYSAAADLVDVEVGTIAKSHTKLEKSMGSAVKGTGASAEAFKKLGVSVTDSNGELRKGDDVWQDVIKALGKVENETERDTLAMQLMGKSASELNPLIEDGGKAYKDLADTLEKYDLEYIDQETLDQANAFNDSLDTIKAVGMVAFQQLGTQLAAYLAPAMEKVVDLVGKIAGWFANLSPETQALIAGVAGIVAVIAPLLIGLGKVSFAISSILSLAATVGPVIAGLAGPIGIAIAVIGALVVAGVLLYKNWDKIKKFAKKLWKDLKNTWEGIKKSVSDAVENMKNAVVTAWNNIKRAVTNAVNAVRTTITTVFNAIKTFIVATVTSWVTSIRTAWDNIKATITTAVNAIKTTITTAFNAIKTTITTILSAIKTVISTTWANIKADINTALTAIKTAVTNVFNAIKTFVTTVWAAIKSAIINPISEAKNKVSDEVSAIASKVKSVFDSLKSAVSSTWNSIKSAITDPIKNAKETVSTTVDNIKTKVGGAFSGLSKSVKTAFDAVKDAITGPIDSAKELVSKAVEKIKSIFPIKLGKIFSGVKLPHFKISGGKVPWGIGGAGTPPKVDIEWYKKGGIFDSPHLIGIGEAGAEAVVPLDRFWKTLEGMSTGETNIVININGANKEPREIAEEVKRMLIKETNQRRLAWQ